MRFGDYAKRSFIPNYNHVIGNQYYINAITKIKHLIPNALFYVFSNDVRRAKALVKDINNCTFVNENKMLSDIEEFKIMELCPNHIISNSTFSWWAAWLNDHNGITIAPNIFFGNKYIIPEEWIKVQTE